MLVDRRSLVLLGLLAGPPAVAEHHAEPPAESHDAAVTVVRALGDAVLRGLAEEVLQRSPRLATLTAEARAAARRPALAKGLPDPTLALTGFLAPPETRVGPQRFSASFMQGIPGPKKRGLRERASLNEAEARQADLAAARLELITRVRLLYHELAFLVRSRAIVADLHGHLLQHEEIARARYSTGQGLGQAVVKLQAEITRVDKELLELDRREVALVAELNALRDSPTTWPIAPIELARIAEVPLDGESLVQQALANRPELMAARARIARAATRVELSATDRRPDFKLGFAYTFVDRREDALGQAIPPEGNGDDVFALQGAITLPIWKKRLSAGTEEATELKFAAEEARRDLETSIRTSIGDLVRRIPLGWRQLRLVEDLLIVQAEEALESALAGYIAGTLNALDLLDAEHVLFDARTAVARARADYLIDLARLEGVVGEPVASAGMEGTDR